MFKLHSNPLNELAFDLIKHRAAVEDSSQFHYSGASAQNLSSYITWKDELHNWARCNLFPLLQTDCVFINTDSYGKLF